MSYGWTELDKQREDERLRDADNRLAAWGVWQRTSGISTGVAQAVIVTEPDPDDQDVFSRRTEIVIIDEECEEVDKILAEMAIRPGTERYWKLSFVEYCTYGPREVKAKRAHLSVHDYRRRVKHLQMLVSQALDKNHRKKVSFV